MIMFEKTITMVKLYLNLANVNSDKWKFMIYLIILGLIGRNFNRGVAGSPAEGVAENRRFEARGRLSPLYSCKRKLSGTPSKHKSSV